MEAKRTTASSMAAPNGDEEDNFDLWQLRTVAERMTTFDLQRLRMAANCSGTSHFSSVFFNPWPAFFKREFNRNWPILIGFAVTGAIITKITYGLTDRGGHASIYN